MEIASGPGARPARVAPNEINSLPEEPFLRGWSFVVRRIALASCLIAAFVIFLVLIFFEAPLLVMVTVMRGIVTPVAHTLLVVLIFRIILVVLFLW